MLRVMKPILRFFGRQIIRYLEKPITNYRSYQFIPLGDLEACLQPGDILLVEGNQRVSSAIKYLTQSTWSHAAYYVGRDAGLRDKYGHPAAVVDDDLADDVIAASLTQYLGYNTPV